jgi:hypothetical protein
MFPCYTMPNLSTHSNHFKSKNMATQLIPTMSSIVQSHTRSSKTEAGVRATNYFTQLVTSLQNSLHVSNCRIKADAHTPSRAPCHKAINQSINQSMTDSVFSPRRLMPTKQTCCCSGPQPVLLAASLTCITSPRRTEPDPERNRADYKEKIQTGCDQASVKTTHQHSYNNFESTCHVTSFLKSVIHCTALHRSKAIQQCCRRASATVFSHRVTKSCVPHSCFFCWAHLGSPLSFEPLHNILNNYC